MNKLVITQISEEDLINLMIYAIDVFGEDAYIMSVEDILNSFIHYYLDDVIANHPVGAKQWYSMIKK